MYENNVGIKIEKATKRKNVCVCGGGGGGGIG